MQSGWSLGAYRRALFHRARHSRPSSEAIAGTGTVGAYAMSRARVNASNDTSTQLSFQVATIATRPWTTVTVAAESSINRIPIRNSMETIANAEVSTQRHSKEDEVALRQRLKYSIPITESLVRTFV